MIIPIELKVSDKDLIELQTLVFDECALSKLNIKVTGAMVDVSNYTIDKLFANINLEK